MSEARPSRREMYAALTKSAIVEAAAELFVERGFDDTSVDDIARESNVSKGAVYHHFRDKREVFAAVWREATAAVSATVAEAVLATPAGTWARVEVAARSALRVYTGDPAARALLRQAVGALGDERAKELELEFALPMIRQLFDEMTAVGLLRAFDTEIAAQLVFRLLCEAALIVAAADDPAAASAKAEPVMLQLLDGLRSPAGNAAPGRDD